MQVQCFYCGEWFNLSEGFSEIDRVDDANPFRLFRHMCRRCYIIRAAFKKVKEKRQSDV